MNWFIALYVVPAILVFMAGLYNLYLEFKRGEVIHGTGWALLWSVFFVAIIPALNLAVFLILVFDFCCWIKEKWQNYSYNKLSSFSKGTKNVFETSKLRGIFQKKEHKK